MNRRVDEVRGAISPTGAAVVVKNWALALFALLFSVCTASAGAEDGHDLWLRYRPIEKSAVEAYRVKASAVVRLGDTDTAKVIERELVRGLSGLLDTPVAASKTVGDGAVVFGTPASAAIAGLHLPLGKLGPDGFLIRSVMLDGHSVTVIAANTDTGALYGAFRYLRLLQMRQPVDKLDIADAPRIKFRIVDHWDNLNRTIERGYAGFSIWDWPKLPGYVDPLYTDYARAEASLGINGVVLNNVNAQAEILTPIYLEKVAALASAFRPYGIKVYLTPRFSAPINIGGLKTADPLDPAVRAWWRAKVEEIYRYVPDFGGFQVKANSEGEPGPQDYGRTHVDGANMLADLLAPHGGIVMWRAFVYSNNPKIDRVAQAVNEFKPFDGKFRDNVVVQIKNGPLDFQPREPFSPLFGAMKHTNLGIELQTTKEYLGFATHLVYLGTLFQEVLESDTYAKGKGSTVAKVLDGAVFGGKTTMMAGISNIGTDRDWSGSTFNQANWYVYGRLAWNPTLDASDIAKEWVAQTFTADPAFVKPTVAMMMASREAAVDYMTPMGLAHLMGSNAHYGPGPWIDNVGRADWNPVYYHRADAQGIGVDRTVTGSNAVSQYAKPVADRFADLKKVDDKYLLWFHHVPWDYKTKSGLTVWEDLVAHYDRGVAEVAKMRTTWDGLKPYVDDERFEKTASYLAIQQSEAQWWRDACIAYFQSVSKRPLPAGVKPPPHDLDYYKAINIPYLPGIMHWSSN